MDAEIIPVATTADISKYFDGLISECKTVNKLIFAGHGDDGYQAAGNLNYSHIQELNQYSCLFDKKAKIDYLGCMVGQSCMGDMLLYQTAKALLSKGGGEVTAPMTWSVSVLFSPHFSLNGVYRTVEYSPEKNPADRWGHASLVLPKESKNINQTCANELDSLIKDYEKAKKLGEQKGCDLIPIHPYIQQENRNLLTSLSQSSRYLQKANQDVWNELFRSIKELQQATERYQNCEPATGKSKTKPGIK